MAVNLATEWKYSVGAWAVVAGLTVLVFGASLWLAKRSAPEAGAVESAADSGQGFVSQRQRGGRGSKNIQVAGDANFTNADLSSQLRDDD